MPQKLTWISRTSGPTVLARVARYLSHAQGALFIKLIGQNGGERQLRCSSSHRALNWAVLVDLGNLLLRGCAVIGTHCGIG